MAEPSGVKHDQEKPMMALIPARAAEEEAWVWTFGARKYGLHNWRRGLTYMRIVSAILRHTYAILRGEDIDPESGKLHAAHIRCDAGMLIEFYLDGRNDLDDRHTYEKPEASPKISIPEVDFAIGDLVKSAYGDVVFEVSAIYYTAELKPVLIIRDQNNQLASVDPVGYVKYGGSVNI